MLKKSTKSNPISKTNKPETKKRQYKKPATVQAASSQLNSASDTTPTVNNQEVTGYEKKLAQARFAKSRKKQNDFAKLHQDRLNNAQEIIGNTVRHGTCFVCMELMPGYKLRNQTDCNCPVCLPCLQRANEYYKNSGSPLPTTHLKCPSCGKVAVLSRNYLASTKKPDQVPIQNPQSRSNLSPIRNRVELQIVLPNTPVPENHLTLQEKVIALSCLILYHSEASNVPYLINKHANSD